MTVRSFWQRSLTEEHGKFENRFCIGSSLAQTEDAFFLLADHEGPSYLAKINKADGETIWKRERESRVSWSSPALMEVDGMQLLVVSSAGTIDAYDANSGDQVINFTDVDGNTVATPIPFGDGQFLVGASPGQSGENTAAAERSNAAMQISVVDGEPQLSVAWRAQRVTSSFGSPMVHDGMAYWVNRSGVVTCFDAASGEQKFSGRLAEGVWATPVGIGDRVYFFGQKGTTTVIAAGDEFDKLGEYRLWEAEPMEEGGRRGGSFGGRTQYGVAVVDGSLLVRTGDRLYCVRP